MTTDLTLIMKERLNQYLFFCREIPILNLLLKRLIVPDLLVEHIDILRFSKFLSDLLAFEHQIYNREESQNAPHTSKKDELKLIPNFFSQENGVKGERHANFLSYEIE